MRQRFRCYKPASRRLKLATHPLRSFPRTLFRDKLTGASRIQVIISAHGYYDRSSNMAGLHVGDNVWLGIDSGPLPPVVILSACHVSPRGAGTVNITDLLFREGALAVLAPCVPVDVFHNSVLMTRLCVYIAETMAAHEPHRTLLDIWHRVATSNAVNDVLNSNASIRKWGFSHCGKATVLEMFMNERANGRLRLSHVYEDTIQILREIAVESGIGHRFDQWITNQGFFPESLFYMLLGWPERILFRDDVVGEMAAGSEMTAPRAPCSRGVNDS